MIKENFDYWAGMRHGFMQTEIFFLVIKLSAISISNKQISKPESKAGNTALKVKIVEYL